MKPVAPLTVSLHPSRRLLVLQLAAHFLGALAVLMASLPPWLAALLLLAVGASLARLRRPAAVTALICHGDGRLEKVGAGGTASEVVLHPHSVALPFLVVLRYRESGRWQGLTLLPDAMPAEDFRRLRRWLRWLSPAGAGAAPSPGRGAASPDNPG